VLVKVLVGVPTYRRPELLRVCLESIARQEIGGFSISVFVADNDPERQEGRRVVDEIAATYPFPISCAVVPEPGISAARNAILEEGYKHQLLAMIDDDEAASPDWLSNLYATMRATDAAVVGGRVEYAITSGGRGWFIRPGPGYSTNNLLVNMRALWRANKPTFDPEFGLTGGEDLEWLTCLKRHGAEFAKADNAVVTEIVPPERQTLRYALSRAHRSGNVCIRVARKYRDGAFEENLLIGAAVLALAPLMAPLLITRKRLWLLTRWSRSIGKFEALFGRMAVGYDRP
jgi:glycosyltransferase involved in cell wall biosynthesis